MFVMPCSGQASELQLNVYSSQILTRGKPGQPSVRASVYPGTN